MQRNARFWDTGPLGNPVKITLRPGQSLRHSHGGRTDEGWTWNETTWMHEGDRVYCAYLNLGADCDGRHDHGGNYQAALDRLAAGYRDADGYAFPDWRADGDEWFRDHTAEAAGY